MREIPLTRGKVALVDDADYDWLVGLGKWTAQPDYHKPELFYAQHSRHVARGRWMLEAMHRLILGITDPKIETDHRDGNGLNNQRHNLRIATHAENARNRALRKDNTSGVTGISWMPRRNQWHVRIQTNGVRKCLGYFDDFEVAKEVRIAEELKMHKAFSATRSRGEQNVSL